MNEKYPYFEMHRISVGLVQRLRPACVRIEVVGSIRRREAEIGDIKIIAIPHTPLDALLAGMQVSFFRNDTQHKQFLFSENRRRRGQVYQAEIFLQRDPATWGINMLLQTGTVDFNHQMVTPKRIGGLMPNDFQIRDARVWFGGLALDTPTEESVFELWGMDWIAPEDRRD